MLDLYPNLSKNIYKKSNGTNTIRNAISFGSAKTINKLPVVNYANDDIIVPSLPSSDLAKFQFEVSNYMQKSPVSIHKKDDCKIIESIIGKLPKVNHGIKLSENQQRKMDLYFESIPAVDKNVNTYIIRQKDQYLFVSTLDNGKEQIISPEALIPKNSYGKEAKRLGAKYWHGNLSENEKINLTLETIRNSDANRPIIKNGNLNKADLSFNIPQITDRKPKIAFINLKNISRDYIIQSPGPNYIEAYLNNKFGKSAIEMEHFETLLNSTDEIKTGLKKSQPDIISISSKIYDYDQLDEYMKFIKKEFPDKLVVLGGPTSTYSYRELLTNYPQTLLMRFAGEHPTAELMKIVLGEKNISHLTEIPNLAFNFKKKPAVTEYKDIKIPGNFRPSESNVEEIIKKGGILSFRFSQGCWGNCSFCTHPGKWSGIEVDDMVSVLKEWKDKYHLKSVFLWDDQVAPKNHEEAYKRLERFSDKMADLDINWSVSLRADCVNWMDDSLVEKIKKGGCNSLFVGVESGSNSQLKRFGKSVHESKIDTNVTSKAIAFFKDKGIKLGIGWIGFDPLMSLKELKDNFKFIEDNNLLDMNINLNSSLRIQKGSRYIKMVGDKNLGLLGDLQPNLFFHDSTYLDPRIGSIKDHLNVWTKESSAIEGKIHEAKFMVSTDPNKKQMYKSYIDIARPLQELTLKYMRALVAAFPESAEDNFLESAHNENAQNFDLAKEKLKDLDFLKERRNSLLHEVTAKRDDLIKITKDFSFQRNELIKSFGLKLLRR